MKIYQIPEINISDIVFEDPKKENGTIMANANIVKDPVIFRINKCQLVDIEKDKRQVILRLKSNNFLFNYFLKTVETTCLITLFSKYKDWFNKKTKDISLLEKNLKQTIHHSDVDFVVDLNINIDYKKKSIKTRIFNTEKKPISYKDISSTSNISLIVQFVGIKMAKNGFMPLYKIVQIMEEEPIPVIEETISICPKCSVGKEDKMTETDNKEYCSVEIQTDVVEEIVLDGYETDNESIDLSKYEDGSDDDCLF